jgi:hypothetical protein
MPRKPHLKSIALLGLKRPIQKNRRIPIARRLVDPCHYQSRDAFESHSLASESARRMALFSFQFYRSGRDRSIAGRVDSAQRPWIPISAIQATVG